MVLKELLAQVYKPDLAAEEGDMVCEIWPDGSVTSTKSGSLYGQRNLHTLAQPLVPKWVEDIFQEDFKEVTGGSLRFPLERVDAMKVREQMHTEMGVVLEYGNRRLGMWQEVQKLQSAY